MPDLKTISISSIEANPFQPRKEFRESELQELAASIKQHGLLQPLLVSGLADGRYRLIAGERRWRAAKQAGLASVPVIVRSANDEQQLELALVENVQRQDLNPLERARGYDQLMKRFGLSQEEVAQKMGKSRSAVANSLRLLSLPEAIQMAVSTGRLTEGHAKIIAGLEGRDLQMRFFDRVVQTNASVRETERAAQKIQSKKRAAHFAAPSSASSGSDNISEYRQLLERALSTKVEIRHHKGTGALTVHFFSDEELVEIIKKIVGEE